MTPIIVQESEMEAFIYDHVRTPRGRGRPDGALNEITPIQLAAQVLSAIRDRKQLDTALVEDCLLYTSPSPRD